MKKTMIIAAVAVALLCLALLALWKSQNRPDSGVASDVPAAAEAVAAQRQTPTETGSSKVKEAVVIAQIVLPAADSRKDELEGFLDSAPKEVREQVLREGVPPVPAEDYVPRIPIVRSLDKKSYTNYAVFVMRIDNGWVIQYYPDGQMVTNLTNEVIILPAVVSGISKGGGK